MTMFFLWSLGLVHSSGRGRDSVSQSLHGIRLVRNTIAPASLADASLLNRGIR